PEPEVEPVETGAPGDAMPEDVFAGDEADASVELDEAEIETIRQLPEADAEIALAQKVCPVSDAPLGSMGVPIKVDARGTPVFICCSGCEDAVAEDPDAILAKVPQGKTDAEAEAPEGEGS